MPTCPICESQAPRAAWQYQTYTIFECPHCRLEFVYPPQSAPLEFYQDHYTDIMATTLADRIHPSFQDTIKKIEQASQRYLLPQQKQVIDVGCGPGYLLSELSRRGFDGFGIDFNPEAVRIANEHFQVKAEVRRLEDLLNFQVKFDLALLIHVLEHVEDPAKLLRNIRQLLRPNGLLFIELPNLNRFSVHRSVKRGTLPPMEYPPHHMTFWSTGALSRALALTGYSVLECHPRPFGEPGEIEAFLIKQFRLPRNQRLLLGAQVLRFIGRSLGLSGNTLFAVARPRPD